MKQILLNSRFYTRDFDLVFDIKKASRQLFRSFFFVFDCPCEERSNLTCKNATRAHHSEIASFLAKTKIRQNLRLRFSESASSACHPEIYLEDKIARAFSKSSAVSIPIPTCVVSTILIRFPNSK